MGLSTGWWSFVMLVGESVPVEIGGFCLPLRKKVSLMKMSK